MSDPAIEAWERSSAKTSPLDALGAAREALAPLRELHKPVGRYLHATGACVHDEHDTFEAVDGEHVCVDCTQEDGGPQRACGECLDEDGGSCDWPCATARLIYSSSELEGDSDAQ